MLISIPFFVLCLLAKDLTQFAIYLTFAQFFFFVSTSPINVAIIEVTPAHLRTSAMAFAIFACHILGDAISAPLIGYISDQTGSLQLGILACTPMIGICALLWWAAARLPKIIHPDLHNEP
jgi:MFS family permease